MLEYDLKPSLKKTSTEPKETFNQTWQNPKPTLNKSQTNTMITSNETTCTQHGGAPTRVLHVHMFTCFALKTDWVPWSNYSVACENRYYCDAALAGGAAPLFQPSPQSPLPFFFNFKSEFARLQIHCSTLTLHVYAYLFIFS